MKKMAAGSQLYTYQTPKQRTSASTSRPLHLYTTDVKDSSQCNYGESWYTEQIEMESFAGMPSGFAMSKSRERKITFFDLPMRTFRNEF